MTDDRALIARLLGPSEPELSCEGCFEALDRYVEAQLAGDDADRLVPGMAAHLRRLPRVQGRPRQPRRMAEDHMTGDGLAAAALADLSTAWPPTTPRQAPGPRPPGRVRWPPRSSRWSRRSSCAGSPPTRRRSAPAASGRRACGSRTGARRPRRRRLHPGARRPRPARRARARRAAARSAGGRRGAAAGDRPGRRRGDAAGRRGGGRGPRWRAGRGRGGGGARRGSRPGRRPARGDQPRRPPEDPRLAEAGDLARGAASDLDRTRTSPGPEGAGAAVDPADRAVRARAPRRARADGVRGRRPDRGRGVARRRARTHRRRLRGRRLDRRAVRRGGRRRPSAAA